MASADRSYFGLAKQLAVDTAKVTPGDDADFKYMLFNQGAAGVNNVVVPLDAEAGGGAMLRDVIKAGYSTGGALEFIPRPDTLGTLLMSLFGNDTYTVAGVEPSKHVFTMNADQYDVPYYTARFAPGGMWWEQYTNVRVNALTLDFKAASFLRGSVGFVGGAAIKMAAAPLTGVTLSQEPPFTSPTGVIEVPSGTAVKVLSGSFTAGSAIPLDEQFVVGAYVPQGFDITQRAFALSFNVKVADNTLYQKMSYDPAGGAAWAAQMFTDSTFKLELSSEKDSSVVGKKHKLIIAANSAKNNVVWSVTPLGLRSGRQVIMTITGMFLAVDTGDPLSVTLYNDQALAY
jgi:hypothetical protein